MRFSSFTMARTISAIAAEGAKKSTAATQ